MSAIFDAGGWLMSSCTILTLLPLEQFARILGAGDPDECVWVPRGSFEHYVFRAGIVFLVLFKCCNVYNNLVTPLSLLAVSREVRYRCGGRAIRAARRRFDSERSSVQQ